MPDIKRKVKIVTHQHVNSSKAPVGDFPIRDWTIEVYLVGDKKEELPATIFDKVTYHLHESFGKKAIQTFKNPPFKLSEQGWGEFELKLVLTPLGKGSPDISINHDLNFLEERYDVIQDVTFKNPKGDLLRVLDEGAENGVRKDKKGRGKKDKNVDMEKLADNMQRMQEEDLLHVVQMIHDQKSSESYIKNDPEAGEFHVDLYTLPDPLVKNLWDFTMSKTGEA